MRSAQWLVVFCGAIWCAAAWPGELNPPLGDVVPTMKPLDQIEPRTPIFSLPFTITSGGAYYLTSNLNAPGGGGDGISIQAGQVSLDLGGFTLTGPGAIVGAGHGITTTNNFSNVKVFNGTVRDWGGNGIHLDTSSECRIVDVMSLENGGSGIRVGDDSFISSCMSAGNSGEGIYTGMRSQVTGNTALGNSFGIYAGTGSNILDNVSANNGISGIQFEGAAVVQRNNCIGNPVGIFQSSGTGAMVSSNTCTDSSTAGISIVSGSVCDNLCTGVLPTSAGLRLRSPNVVVERNTALTNDVGIDAQTEGGYYASNRAHGNTTAFALGASPSGSGDTANISY